MIFHGYLAFNNFPLKMEYIPSLKSKDDIVITPDNNSSGYNLIILLKQNDNWLMTDIIRQTGV